MTVRTRHFLVNGEEIRPLTQSVLDRLRGGEVRLPAYAGQDLHVADVAVEISDRAPVKVRDVSTEIVSLDERGGVRSRLLEELRASLSASRTGRLPAQARWTPSPAQLDRITDLALGRAKSKLKPPRTAAASDMTRAERRSTSRRGRRAGRRHVAADKSGG